MKNELPRFIFFALLSLSSLISGCSQALPRGSGTLVSISTDQTPLSSVKITHTWAELKGGLLYQQSESSLGTAVGARLVLTHSHFTAPSMPFEDEALTFSTSAGEAVTVPMVNLTSVASDRGTQMFYLPDGVALTSAPVGDAASLSCLAEGAWLEVEYWDDTRQHFAQGYFQVKRLEAGVATLADPEGVISSGDSGGGVYVGGKLIGNTWAIQVNAANGHPLGAFNVALLPAEAITLAQPEEVKVWARLSEESRIGRP